MTLLQHPKHFKENRRPVHDGPASDGARFRALLPFYVAAGLVGPNADHDLFASRLCPRIHPVVATEMERAHDRS